MREPVHEVVDQDRDVGAAVAQRRDDEMNDVETVEQVFAELPLADPLAEVAVGRGDDADVQLDRGVVGADFLQLAGLEEPEQHALHPQGHLADLVQEDRAAVAHFELAGLVPVGAGEAALDVTEQLGFEEGLGNAGAVDGDERLARRSEPSWMARATSSLPTPLSPVIRTLASDGEMRPISSRRSAISALVPMRSVFRCRMSRSPRRAPEPVHTRTRPLTVRHSSEAANHRLQLARHPRVLPPVDGRKRFRISRFQCSQCGRMVTPSRAKHLVRERKKSSMGLSRPVTFLPLAGSPGLGCRTAIKQS